MYGSSHQLPSFMKTIITFVLNGDLLFARSSEPVVFSDKQPSKGILACNYYFRENNGQGVHIFWKHITLQIACQQCSCENYCFYLREKILNLLSANPTKWSNTLTILWNWRLNCQKLLKEGFLNKYFLNPSAPSVH